MSDPGPTDRGRSEGKHHVLTDANGVPLVVDVSLANVAEVKTLLDLVVSVPPVRGKVGQPRQKPEKVQGDREYNSEPHRRKLLAMGIEPVLAKRGTEHGNTLGLYRWAAERTISCRHNFCKLRTVTEHRHLDWYPVYLLSTPTKDEMYPYMARSPKVGLMSYSFP